MQHDELRQSIIELKAEIATLEQDDDSRDELIDLADRMEARLQASEREEEPTPFDDIYELIARYEARYPKVTLMANYIMNRLASMGI